MEKSTLPVRVTFRKNSHKSPLTRPDDGGGDGGREAELWQEPAVLKCSKIFLQEPVMVWGLILRRNGQPLVIGIEVCHSTIRGIAQDHLRIENDYFDCPDFMRDHFCDFSGI